MPKISVIIPVYNARENIVRAVGSVLKQTLKDIEIICINDASTDDSLEILLDLEKIYPDKIIVINSEENLGAGGARNLGLDMARGRYVGFVDSDDYVTPNMFELLYEEAKKGDYDIVDAGFYDEAKDNAIIYTSDDLKGDLDGYKRSELIVSGGFLWSKIFKRKIWNNPQIRMREHAILEDADILTYFFATARNIGNVKEILYCYTNTPGSLSKESNTQKYYKNIYNAIEAIYNKTNKLENYKEIQEAVEYELYQLYSFGINVCLKGKHEKEKIPYKKMIEKLIKLRRKVITGEIEKNRYVKAKMSEKGIEVIRKVEEKGEK